MTAAGTVAATCPPSDPEGSWGLSPFCRTRRGSVSWKDFLEPPGREGGVGIRPALGLPPEPIPQIRSKQLLETRSPPELPSPTSRGQCQSSGKQGPRTRAVSASRDVQRAGGLWGTRLLSHPRSLRSRPGSRHPAASTPPAHHLLCSPSSVPTLARPGAATAGSEPRMQGSSASASGTKS